MLPLKVMDHGSWAARCVPLKRDGWIVAVAVMVGTLVASLAGCGAGRAAAPATATPSAARRCLSRAGFYVVGGVLPREASNGTGAVAELDVNGAFIVFYPSAAVELRALTAIQKNVRRLHGTVVHHGGVTIAFVGGTPLSDSTRRAIDNCTF
jgi:hypothetical protein